MAIIPHNPVTRGHTMVPPRQHARDIWDITPASWASTMAYAHQLTAHLREIHQPAGLNVIQSNGTAATQTVWHLHIHRQLRVVAAGKIAECAVEVQGEDYVPVRNPLPDVPGRQVDVQGAPDVFPPWMVPYRDTAGND